MNQLIQAAHQDDRISVRDDAGRIPNLTLSDE